MKELITQRDKELVRELAKQYRELADSDEQRKMNQRMKDTNDRKLVRPPVILEEIPWYQMDLDGELTCQCENQGARNVETFFRRALFRRKHFRADTMFEPFFRVTMAYDSSGIGIKRQEETLATESGNHIVSHSFEDVLEEEDSVELIKIPTFTPPSRQGRKGHEFLYRPSGGRHPRGTAGCGHPIPQRLGRYRLLPRHGAGALRSV